MAVYTHLDRTELEAWLAEHYPQLGNLQAMEGISEGVENSNYLLRMGESSTPYILTIYEKRVKLTDLDYFLGLMLHAKEKGCPVPEPVHRADNKLWCRMAGKGAAIFTFMPGRNMMPANQETLHALGQALAQFHAATRDFSPQRENDLSPFILHPLLEKSRAWLEGVRPGLAEGIAAELHQLAHEVPDDLPRGQIHADLFRDNVFFEGNRVSGLIDFYFACTDTYAYDLAIIGISWCFEGAVLNHDLLGALLDGYARTRPLSAREKAALPLLMRGACIRFMLTRAYDVIHQVPGAQVVVKDPGEYLDRWKMLAQLAGKEMSA